MCSLLFQQTKVKGQWQASFENLHVTSSPNTHEGGLVVSIGPIDLGVLVDSGRMDNLVIVLDAFVVALSVRMPRTSSANDAEDKEKHTPVKILGCDWTRARQTEQHKDEGYRKQIECRNGDTDEPRESEPTLSAQRVAPVDHVGEQRD